MNTSLILILSLLFITGWILVSYLFVKINRQTQKQRNHRLIQPALRLADQWMMESQRKIEALIGDVEQPLSTAQNELLELRLEAGRLPQGVKNIRTIRDLLAGPIHLGFVAKNLSQIAALYLSAVDYQVEDANFIYFKTDIGIVPAFEVARSETVSDLNMKKWLNHLSTQANLTIGGLLYFAHEDHFKICQENEEWTAALRQCHIMALNFESLTALLISLKLSHQTNRLIEVVRVGIQNTTPLVGEADKMSMALNALGASALKVQFVLDGGSPQAPVVMEGGKTFHEP